MHITLISACERRAVKRSRAILDSYAIRTGIRSWATPITLEGVRELRGLLKASATRQTAVACYRNEGRERMRLLWVVGSRDSFGPEGHFPAGHTRRRQPPPFWLRIVGLLAHAAGLGHDLGKSGNFFAGKLARAVAGGPPEADPVRHEWISMRLLQERRRGNEWSQAWLSIAKKKSLCEPGGLEDTGIDGPLRALDYLIATHHRLFGPAKGTSTPTSEKHVAEGERARELVPAGTLPDELLELLERVQARLIRKAGERSPAFWRGAAVLARAALILADHEVSARPWPGGVKACELFANTKDGAFDQPLDWHLRTVGGRAADFAWRMAALRLPGLATESVEHILSPADERGRFAWQNQAVAAVAALRERSEGGLLIFNIAATGAGKTIANAKLACSVSSRPRFAIALNLRTLTLQTGDALADDLGLGEDELATVIGDRIASRLHAAGKADDPAHAGTFETEGPATEYDARGGEVELPEWMKVLTERRPVLRSVIGAPVLVSTIDYLINAGEPGRQGHHVSALMRMIDSDLVLDEVDSYEPVALVAVLRLVQVVGLMGRSVICSSATLPQPVAEAVFRAFRCGVEMRCALEEREARFGIAIVDDRTAPTTFASDADLPGQFAEHVGRLLAVPRKAVRRAWVQPVNGLGGEAFLAAISDAVRRLHEAHSWVGPGGKRLSFGLVRVANIGTAIRTARQLARAVPHARVACYHAQEFRIQRHLKEKRLDFLLNRKRGDGHIVRDEEIIELMAASAATDVPFIVVATPVEEIGRDHDFDWGVIEPSSAHSIVQTAGRINRHRLREVSEPNVAILQYNRRWLEGRQGEPCFVWPGLESKSQAHRYSSPDLLALLADADLEALDARLRLGRGLMARDEDRIVRERLETPLSIVEADEGARSEWMTQAFYANYALRDGVQHEAWRAERVNGFWVFKRQARPGEKESWMTRSLDEEVRRQSNDWLTWDLEELVTTCVELDVTPASGLELQVRYQAEGTGLSWDQSFGFFLSKP
ncbi:P-loop NTPase family protein [Rhodocyclus tenuis]|uniref:CRISPR-associated endonuclease/helicase Cas3 n=1 Tax=Rhodocyclus tenuis TaxID=1066 RepID=A0A840G6J2_RHOTE|nr:type I-F CRISPR-associated helicase Cas3 [Rhodocyclus tenuis]MBB4246570.1 CRISPR-associated endonuclease/helicase Cas3 [Rhodocyclus tenuis]